jgi:NAD-dependent deacetylase
MMMPDTQQQIERLAQLIRSSGKIVAFTGAGISTAAGISDYRSKGGLWDRFQPVYYEEFLEEEEKRLEYWRRKQEMWPQIRDARPSEGHRFIYRLHRAGKLRAVITQNVDGLHEQSGIPPEKILNLHGNNREIVCLSCGALTPAAEFFPSLELSEGAPRCGKCGGLLKPNTVSFGQSLDPAVLEKAQEASTGCDLMLALGSTLQVYPAAGFPSIATRSGATLAIVTLSETPLDGEAHLVLREDIDTVSAELARRLFGT